MTKPKQESWWETIKRIMDQVVGNLMQPITNAIGSRVSTASQRSDVTHLRELAFKMSEKDREELKAKATILENRSDELTRKITALNVERNPLVKQVEREPGYASQFIEITILIKPDGFWNKTKAKWFGLKKEIIRKTVEVRIEELNAEIEGATTEKGDITARLKEIGTIMGFYRTRDSGVFEAVNSQAPEHMVQQAGDVNYADMRDFDGILDEA